MSKESISRLAALTGMARETVAKRLIDIKPTIDGKAKTFESRIALSILYERAESETDYDLTEERARLAHYQANIAALDEQIKKKELIPYDVVVSRWQMIIANFRAKALSMPTTLAAVCVNMPRDDIQVQAEIHIKQMLEELAVNADY